MMEREEEQTTEELSELIGQLVYIKPKDRYSAYKVTQPWAQLLERPGIFINEKCIPNIDGTPSLNKYWGVWTGDKTVYIPTVMYQIILWPH